MGDRGRGPGQSDCTTHSTTHPTPAASAQQMRPQPRRSSGREGKHYAHLERKIKLIVRVLFALWAAAPASPPQPPLLTSLQALAALNPPLFLSSPLFLSILAKPTIHFTTTTIYNYADTPPTALRGVKLRRSGHAAALSFQHVLARLGECVQQLHHVFASLSQQVAACVGG